ncbi:MAG: ATP-dependent DNA helicase RecG [Rubricella sp.]
MSQRPESLFPLFADLTGLLGIGQKGAQALTKGGLAHPRDLVFTLPAQGIDRRLIPSIREAVLPAVCTVEVEIGAHHAPRSRGRPYRVDVRDAQADFTLVFFHANADWLRRTLPSGQRRIVSGRVELFDGLAQMAHPDHILTRAEAEALPGFEPVYPLTYGITQKQMTRAIQAALERMPPMPEWIDPGVVAEQGFPGFNKALADAHAPQSVQDLSPNAPARRRLAYDELLSHQMTLALARARDRRRKGRVSKGTGVLQRKVLAALPYSPTRAQQRAVSEILADLESPFRMHRLLQGDVGSGKTLTAFLPICAVVEAGGQAAMMAPTEILARQHLESLAPLAEAAGLRVEILTGRDKGADRAAKLGALAAGEIGLLVGTHALFSEDVAFADLRLAVIDEQHRFGVHQRMSLGAKGQAVDILVMTATPIPRSLALSQFGDMDLSVLDEKPPGRKPITTVTIPMDRLDEVVERLRRAVEEGRQAYWVCPLVEESEHSAMTAAEVRFKALRAALGDGVVGLVHGQMPPSEKDVAMADFVAGRTRVLVATTVIEVGVNVPEATIMVIEGAESFGLAQLHQLRGRVGRGEGASTCLLLYQGPLGETAYRRLAILRETEDGFRIAEEDLALRGAGDLIGTAQSGLPLFQIADLERQADLMAIAQKDARLALQRDPDLSSARGEALRLLLWLMERDRAIRLIGIG